MRYAVTGPRKISCDEEVVVRRAIMALGDEVAGDSKAEFTSGAAFGVDSYAMRVAGALPFAVRRLVVPVDQWYNEVLVQIGMRRGWNIVEVEGSYMDRNDVMVDRFCDTLVAFPATSDEKLRSGTWATIRRARKAGCEIVVSPLDGGDPWIETLNQRKLVT